MLPGTYAQLPLEVYMFQRQFLGQGWWRQIGSGQTNKSGQSASVCCTRRRCASQCRDDHSSYTAVAQDTYCTSSEKSSNKKGRLRFTKKYKNFGSRYELVQDERPFFQESEVHAVMGEIYPEILLICVLQYVPLPTRHRTVALLFIYVRQMFWSFIFLGKFEPYGIPISGEKTKHPSLTAQQGRTEHV